jgi:hypothetical protein
MGELPLSYEGHQMSRTKGQTIVVSEHELPDVLQALRDDGRKVDVEPMGRACRPLHRVVARYQRSQAGAKGAGSASTAAGYPPQ